jgi:hypothetical protein
MSLKFTAGDLTIHRLIEEETTFLPAHDVFAGLTPDLLAENRQWLRDSGASSPRLPINGIFSSPSMPRFAMPLPHGIPRTPRVF